MRGVFLDTETIDGGDLDLTPITGIKDIHWTLFGTTGPETVDARIKDCEVVICNKALLNEQSLNNAAKLELIVVAATGTNNIDLGAARSNHITVCNVRGYGTPSVVQHVYSLILALTIRLPKYMTAVATGKWQKHPHFCLFDYPIRELSGKVLGIVGHGSLGKGVADAAPAFDLQVKIAQRPGTIENHPNRVPLAQLLPMVDILSLHCPLTPVTEGLIGAEQLSSMKDDSLLINTARGGIVDELALANALREGIIGGAGVDVLSDEPPTHGNILLDPGIPNLIVTPHIAWAARESRQRVAQMVGEQVRAFLNHQPKCVVS